MTGPAAPTVAAPVKPCLAECLSHRCGNPCRRPRHHPDDFASHICDGCASVLPGWF